MALGGFAKPLLGQVFSIDFWKSWQPGEPFPGLGWPALGILASLGVGWCILYGIDRLWLTPLLKHADVANGALEHLYKSWFGSEAGHRVSFLAKRAGGWNIRVFFRYSFGTGIRFRSRAHFPKGVALAGKAWRYPGKFFGLKIPPKLHDDAQAFREYMCKTYGLTRWQANLLSDETARTRWIVCYGIADPAGEFRGVLSVDSELEDALKKIVPPNLKSCVDLLGAVLRAHDHSKTD